MTEDGTDLFQATEILNDLLNRVPDALVSKGFVVTAGVPLSEGQQLVFGKRNQTWTLVIRSGADDIHFTELPLLQASRGIRVQAAKKLSALLEQLQLVRAGMVLDIQHAQADVTRFLTELEKT